MWQLQQRFAHTRVLYLYTLFDVFHITGRHSLSVIRGFCLRTSPRTDSIPGGFAVMLLLMRCVEWRMLYARLNQQRVPLLLNLKERHNFDTGKLVAEVPLRAYSGLLLVPPLSRCTRIVRASVSHQWGGLFNAGMCPQN